MVRNDMGCGYTIAPILASGMGVRTVDCGTGQAFHAQVLSSSFARVPSIT